MNRLYIIRHGKTDWNDKGLIQGSTDIPLNKEGITKTEELANNIDLSKIDICICSPLKRAKQTADILAQNKIPILYDDLLIERSFGDYEGKKVDFDLIAKQWDYKLNDSSNNIESIKDCLARANSFLNKLRKEYDNKNILIISHGSFIKALHFNLIGYNSDTDFLSFSPQNSILYEYDLN